MSDVSISRQFFWNFRWDLIGQIKSRKDTKYQGRRIWTPYGKKNLKAVWLFFLHPPAGVSFESLET